MSLLTATYDGPAWSARLGQRTSPVAGASVAPSHTADVDLLIDLITGAGRCELEGLSVAHVYNVLAARITELGLRPAEQKLLRIAYWIVASPA